MINGKKEYLEYLEADKKALRVGDGFRDRYFHEIWKFQKLLRLLEYRLNCKNSFFSKFYTLWIRYRFQQASVRLGFSISPNSCGAGLELGHYGDIVINGKARIGKNCTIAGAGVLIGEDLKNPEAPTIGDNCYIGTRRKNHRRRAYSRGRDGSRKRGGDKKRRGALYYGWRYCCG